MTPDALAIVFSPNLLRAPVNDFLMIMSNMPHTNKLVKTLITNVSLKRYVHHPLINFWLVPSHF